MPRPVALVDWDGTLRKGFTIRSWMEHLHGIGLFSQQVIVELERQFHLYSKRKITYDELAKVSAQIYGQSVKGKPVQTVKDEARAFLASDMHNLLELPLQLVTELRQHNVEPIIISGGPCEVLMEYKQSLQLSNIFCLQLAKDGTTFNGKVAINPGLTSVKHKIVANLLKDEGIQVILAMGNSISDEPLFAVAPLTVIVGKYVSQKSTKIIRLSDRYTLSQVLSFLDKKGRGEWT